VACLLLLHVLHVLHRLQQTVSSLAAIFDIAQLTLRVRTIRTDVEFLFPASSPSAAWKILDIWLKQRYFTASRTPLTWINSASSLPE